MIHTAHARDFNLHWFCPIARRVSGKGASPSTLPNRPGGRLGNREFAELSAWEVGNGAGKPPFPETRLAIGQNHHKLKSRA